MCVSQWRMRRYRLGKEKEDVRILCSKDRGVQVSQELSSSQNEQSEVSIKNQTMSELLFLAQEWSSFLKLMTYNEQSHLQMNGRVVRNEATICEFPFWANLEGVWEEMTETVLGMGCDCSSSPTQTSPVVSWLVWHSLLMEEDPRGLNKIRGIRPVL